MTDWGRSGRRDSFSFHLVDPFTLEETGETIEVEAASCSITWGWDTKNGYSGSFRAVNASNRDKLVRVKQAIAADGEERTVTLGTFFIDEAPASALYGRVSRNLSAYSTMWRFTEDVLARDFVRKKGYNVTTAIRDIVEIDGGRLIVDPEVNSTRCFGRDIWFEVAANRAETLRTIASWINCIMRPDADGYIVLEPYRAPKDRAVRYEFEAGRNCVYLPGVEVADTSASAVNRVVAWWSRSSVPKTAREDADGNTVYDYDDDYGLSDYAYVDLPETHAFAYERIGRRRTYVMKLTEACSHADLTAKAQQYLDENCGSTRYFEIQHVSVPDVSAGDVVRYVNPYDYSEPIDCACIVEEISMTLSPGAPCKTKLREVAL